MKTTITIASLVAAVSAHSWLECTNHDNSQIRGWMQGNSTLSPPTIIDPAMPWYANLCAGWPRNKANPGNWLDESSNYIWNIGANSWDGGAYHPPDTHACHPNQRSPTYQANAPMASAAPGGTIKLRFGGNGHTRGAPMGDAGSVSVYWKGKPEAEITDVSEFTDANMLQTAGFGADSFSYPADPKVISPVQGLVDKGNWMNLKLPADIAPGRHMMVWVWSYSGAKQWSTCFDINVTGSASGSSSSSTSTSSGKSVAAAVASPAAAVQSAKAVPEPKVNAQVPAAQTKSDDVSAGSSYGDNKQATKPVASPVAEPIASAAAASAAASPVKSVVPSLPSTAAQVQDPAAGKGEKPRKSHCKAKFNKRSHARSFA